MSGTPPPQPSPARGEGEIAPRVRFAPSPTGKLHLGSARTALINWLVARGSQGRFVLRLEDTDVVRSEAEFERDITDSLKWMGLDWDEGPDIGGPHGPYRQSERMEIYRERALELLEAGRAYKCFCTNEELDARKEEAKGRGVAWRYDRRCLGLAAEEAERLEGDGVPYTIRFRVPDGRVTVNDLLRGGVTVDASEIADFIILRSDGRAGFNLAVVVDDITMDITLVIRGDDHLTNAVRHVMLFEALGSEPPRFLHHSLLHGPDGAKLSKRHGATSVSDYREKGYLPEALVNYLVLLSWSPGAGDEREIFTLDELVSEFSIEGLSASKAIFDFDKLNWLDRQHLKKLSDSQVTDRVIPFLEKEGRAELLALPRDRLEIAIASVRNNMETLADAVEPLDVYARRPGEFTDKASAELQKSEDLNEAFALCVEALRANAGPDRETAERIVSSLREEAKSRGWGAKKMLWPLRLGITGHTVGPDLVYLIMFYTPEGCADRIELARQVLEGKIG